MEIYIVDNPNDSLIDKDFSFLSDDFIGFLNSYKSELPPYCAALYSLDPYEDSFVDSSLLKKIIETCDFLLTHDTIKKYYLLEEDNLIFMLNKTKELALQSVATNSGLLFVGD